MKETKHPISAAHGSVQVELTSFHFGQAGGKKAYIQASLHADEVPAMLVAQFLRNRLQELEGQGKVTGEVILVPAANPIGLSQVINERPFGRFDLSTGTNFNREYPHYAGRLKEVLAGQLGSDPDANVRLVRQHLRSMVAEWQPASDTTTLKKALLQMALDADVMLDLHCENEGALHIYCGTPLLPGMAPLSALMQASALLYTTVGGGEPFDEACGRLWWDLHAHFGDQFPIPPACISATVELRGETSVNYEVAKQDAEAILRYLATQGILDMGPVELPVPLCQPTPLEGAERINAPHNGMLVYLRELGETILAGEAIADLIDPVTGHTTPLTASVDGVFFARLSHRYVIRGMNVGKIAGAKPFRTGNLLSL